MPEMIAVERALALVLEAARPLPPVAADLDEAAGRILLETIRADRDQPAWDKALMDGFAVIAADVTAGRELRVAATIAAGADPATLAPLRAGETARIMTGAPLPPAADAVVPVEQSREGASADRVRFEGVARPGDHLARRGADVREGAMLLDTGDLLGPAEIGTLAACGRTRVQVGARPRVAVLATGDELVPPDRPPGEGRLRNSNGPMLQALARRAGAEARDLGIARDDPQALRAAIESGLDSDALVLSGGVSMGLYDLVGSALREAGAEVLFERVAIRPGKPFTFARRGATLVFGCPGNPVSSYVIFQVFVRPALRRLAAHPRPGWEAVPARLAAEVRQRPGREGFAQVRARFQGGRLEADPVPTTGSADLVSCARGNALAILSAAVAEFPAGSEVPVILLDDHADR
ncbi:MAG TPA: gephyrin-like molybdotransferase Glp [Candidatus Polarisedimenticolia bacterium]|nr:gephyrin-like molybdotransferase Glp [Candidatus Polarisedimenticolia bacterium]